MDMRLAIGDHRHAEIGQLVLDAADGDFVAWDNARREDDGVAVGRA